jgi:hypothetical protein
MSAAGSVPVVAVRPASALTERARLFGALEQAYPVAFRAWDGADAEPPAAVVTFAAAGADDVLPAGTRELVLAGRRDERGAPVAPVTLADVDGVDARLRGAELFDALDAEPLRPAPGEVVLATGAAGPAWTRSPPGDAAPIDRVASTLPELDAEQALYSRLGDRAVAMVALIDLLRAVGGPRQWRAPAPRAAIVFDDPNLRSRCYGHIDYAALVRHADAHGYHAAMAMIPLDAGRADRAAVDLFKNRADRLSLVFHGNDHRKRELLMPTDDASATAMAAQALRRVERFEARTGLRVDRVMMPPHGLCSEPMSRALGAVGFDALSAIHPLPWTEDWRSGPVLAGWRAADLVAGCPVIPRMPLTCHAADVALRAYLGHPIILYGHHQDVAGGFDLLAENAARVNRIAGVRWESVGAIAAANYDVLEDGDRLDVLPLSRRIALDAASHPRTVVVREPEDALRAGALVAWSADGGARRAFGEALEVPAGAAPVIRLHGAADVDPATVRVPAWRPGPKLRRAATEARDRAVALRLA